MFARSRWHLKPGRYWRNRALYRAIRIRNLARVLGWDALARAQSQKLLNDSFLFWESASRPPSLRVSRATYPRYLCDYPRSAVIEPKYCFAIADHGELIETSVSNAYFVRDTRLRHLFGLPSLVRYFTHRYLTGDTVDVGPVVSLSTAWAENYFHFYNDFLPKVLLLEECNVDPSLPIVVPDKLFRQSFFHDAIRSERLSRWTFIAPQGRYLKCDRVVFCSDSYDVSNRRKFEDVVPLLGLDPGLLPGRATRKIFLTRAAARGRVLTNLDEIRPLLEARNFELVDTDGLSLAAQAQLFRETRYLVGIHGAGLVNVVHAMGQELDVLEIRPPGVEYHISDYRGEYIAGAEFEILCRSLDFGYSWICGEPDPERVHWHESFRLEPEILTGALDRTLLRQAD
jgi:hypothetical protein